MLLELFESHILVDQGHPSFLCQPDSEKGCGGCCVNFEQPRQILEKVFSIRKEAYDAWVRSEGDILPYKKKMDLLEKGHKQCRFLAFLDDGKKKIGCLLHPNRLENGNRDLRDYGFYDDHNFCATIFCGSSKGLLKRDAVDKQFFFLIQEDLDWYNYSRLFSFYVDLDGTKGLFDIYAKYTRPLYKKILQRVFWKDIQGKGFLKRYHGLLKTIVNKTNPPLDKFAREGYGTPFKDIIGILWDRRQVDIINVEIEKFIDKIRA